MQNIIKHPWVSSNKSPGKCHTLEKPKRSFFNDCDQVKYQPELKMPKGMFMDTS